MILAFDAQGLLCNGSEQFRLHSAFAAWPVTRRSSAIVRASN
jgi:hypothetical protein